MKLNGANELKRKLNNISRKAKQDIESIVLTNANDIATDAIQNSPRVYKYAGGGEQPTNGEINQSIKAEKAGDLKWRVTVNSVMGAYAEFGTGAYVDVPAGWEKIAWAYYVNGKGLMMPSPYLYPAFRKGQERFIKDLDNYLKNID